MLAPSGFTYRQMPPEGDAINYVSRVKIPVLMLGGRHDYIFPLETAQKPMFERLGTPAEHKRQVIFDSGHTNFPRSESIREVLGWLDRYLGPSRHALDGHLPSFLLYVCSDALRLASAVEDVLDGSVALVAGG